MLSHRWIVATSVSTNALMGALTQLRTFNMRRKNVIKQGFLVKQGHFIKNWKRRSFVLTRDRLSYYENEDSAQPRGSIDLKDIATVEPAGDGKRDSFRIATRQGKTYLIQASSEQEKEEWMNTVEAVRRG